MMDCVGSFLGKSSRKGVIFFLLPRFFTGDVSSTAGSFGAAAAGGGVGCERCGGVAMTDDDGGRSLCNGGTLRFICGGGGPPPAGIWLIAIRGFIRDGEP